MKPQTLLRLYPRRWRDRYGDEFLALLEQEGTGPRVVVSVFAGAFDAWMSPGSRGAMAVDGPIGPQVLWIDRGAPARKFEPGSWPFLGGAIAAGLLVHGIGQLIHPGKFGPVNFLAGFMATWQVWIFRVFSTRTRIAAVFWVFFFMTAGAWAGMWLIHSSLHKFVYPWFGK
jgi:hypothetical protein